MTLSEAARIEAADYDGISYEWGCEWRYYQLLLMARAAISERIYGLLSII